jgi:hypothetical protein
MTMEALTGRSGRTWTLRAFHVRPGHLRPYDGSQPHQVDLVSDDHGNTFGALRRFADRHERGDALALLGIVGPVGPTLLDVVDVAGAPPSIVTAWAPGRSARPLDQLSEPDDLLTQVQEGRRWTPAAALRLLVPLGDALDRFARRKFVPLELSPDHLVENGGGIRLVGWSRHLYRPLEGKVPSGSGMSLATTQMLCGEMPGPSATLAEWRQSQVRMILRLAGWMCGGLPPGLWDAVEGPGQDEYLRASGFASIPTLKPGQLAQALSAAARTEQTAEAERRVRQAKCVVLFDGTSPARVNPEALRLGLLQEHGPDVIAVAALPPRQTSPMAALLSGAGWLMIEANRFPRVLQTVRRMAPEARIVVAGEASERLAAALPPKHDEILPHSAQGPRVAGRSAATLPFLDDPDLAAYAADVLSDQGGAALKRQTFAAGWALAFDDKVFREKKARFPGRRVRQLIDELTELNSLYGMNTELLLRVAEVRERDGLRQESWNKIRRSLEVAAPVLLGMPSRGALRNDLMHALLSRTVDDLHADVTRRLLPVARRLTQIYDPGLRLGDSTLEALLYTREGIRQLGLLGRLATALPGQPVPALLDAVGRLDQKLVDALLDIPAPSLQYLVGRLGSAELFDVLRPFIDGPDLDLLGQFTPDAWRVLLEGLRQPEHLSGLGLGWALVVDRDRDGIVDPWDLLEIATQAETEARYVVRTLLEAPVGQWSRLLAAPGLAVAWLRAFGRLDAGPVLDAYQDAAGLLRRFSPQGLRAAAIHGMESGLLAALDEFASRTGMPAGDVVTTFLDVCNEAGEDAGDDARHTETFASPAAAAWASTQLAAGMPTVDFMADLIYDPALLGRWVINGDRLPSRVLAGVLGADPAELGVGREEGIPLVELLEAQPALLPMLRDLVFPSQRLTFLRLAAASPARSLATQLVRDALPYLVDGPDAEEILALILGEQLTYPQARTAVDRGLDIAGRVLLRSLGPLPPSDDLLAAASIHGIALARDAAILEQTRPGSIKVVRAWGTRWLPLLAGPSGRRIAAMLAGYHNPGPVASAWLREAGEDGLAALARHGPALLTLAGQTDAHPADAKILAEILRLGGDAAAYHFITRHGVPYAHWPTVVARSGEPPENLLLALWSSDGWPAARAEAAS